MKGEYFTIKSVSTGGVAVKKLQKGIIQIKTPRLSAIKMLPRVVFVALFLVAVSPAPLPYDAVLSSETFDALAMSSKLVDHMLAELVKTHQSELDDVAHASILDEEAYLTHSQRIRELKAEQTAVNTASGQADNGFFAQAVETMHTWPGLTKKAATFGSRAVVELMAGRPEEALLLMIEATDNNPEDPRAWFGRGLLLHEIEMNLGGARSAEDSYRKALSLDPNYALAWTTLGRLLEAEVHRAIAAALLNHIIILVQCRPLLQLAAPSSILLQPFFLAPCRATTTGHTTLTAWPLPGRPARPWRIAFWGGS